MKSSENLVIQPGKGVLPIVFGMKPSEVAELFETSPYRSRLNRNKEREEFWECNGKHLSVTYNSQDDEVIEITLYPGLEAWIGTVKILGTGAVNPIQYLRWLDDSPLEGVGVMLFKKIGISTSGFHDNDKSQESITVAAPGRFDSILHLLTPCKA
ncbi:hypothetical protein IB232_06650 [Pseudomonas sp. PDM15]|uniref:hypothetical protein n=1 Tax=Pseudomonas sp. PDM15 TaxID=2769303 RepID=UPI00178314A2|nr:hypothetical protein [Pseudomonas sp. PDM15]MBD9424992.1 hypothetical protein [Pseudomonas sp. PDM15]